MVQWAETACAAKNPEDVLVFFCGVDRVIGMTNFQNVFGTEKPVIGMVHLGALPGTPLHEESTGLEGLVEAARADLNALCAAGFDAVMFGNENDRPYELQADAASTATMAYVIGRIKDDIRVPFGVNVLWDPMATIALAAATGAAFVREIFTGNYASDMGAWSPDAARAVRYRNSLGRSDLAMLFNISAEFAHSLDRRPLAERARSAEFSSIPDAVLVSGPMTGELAELDQVAEVKRAVADAPVLVNTGVRHETVKRVLRICDGCVVGTALKQNGVTWNPVDPVRAADFMALAREVRRDN